MKNNVVERVILLHDINSSRGTGMQNNDSRYLLSWEVVNRGIEEALNNSIEFEKIKFIKKNNENEKFVRITIDDGGGSSLDIADYLANKNIKAYFFIPTKFIGEKGFLKKDDINKLIEMGHVVGSHSHTHPNPFCELDELIIKQEVIESKKILEEITQQKITTFSVPGGEIRKKTLKILSDDELGLEEIYISTPYQGKYYFSDMDSSKVFGRLCIERKMSYRDVTKYIKGDGWKFVFFDYQLRRFRRELIYKYNHIFKNN